jgi:NadR type nicotinamide-nucleotide adenylyltransferase
MLKVVIIGPESTGKSTLCQQLALHYNTLWCPEYAREYLLKNGMNYSYDDLLTIAKGQIDLEEKKEEEVRKSSSDNRTLSSGLPGFPTSGLLFIDTNMYVMKVWYEFVFGKCHRFILDQIEKRKYDLYLLCNTDLPWIKDELRDYPDPETRQRLYLVYKEMMINQPVPWVEISGDYERRLQTAIIAADELFRK